jgi:hypothetical protein
MCFDFNEGRVNIRIKRKGANKSKKCNVETMIASAECCVMVFLLI